ncbi:MAG: hypothetical protein CFH01_01688 [Alphaproteobacteria bacterium MarineAlpha2_Bin1]|nr:MAG: hypothetical protein CFH01_01688 [Alphaproteobacteria bacterium MarineAlpha2_Bin1]
MNKKKNTHKLIKELLTKELSETELGYFNNKFPNSLLHVKAKFFLSHLIKTIKPKSALEIGTFMAGTTKIISEAMGKNGLIVTIEANKQRHELIKKEISTWEKESQKNTVPITITSNDFFNITKLNEKVWFDIIFIDGDHTYTGALTDLINSSRFASPGAIIVVDDAVQPPVFSAVKSFLTLKKNWKEVSGIFEENSGSYIKPKSSFDSIPFLILEGPDKHSISNQNYSVFREFKKELKGINLILSQPADPGILYARFLVSHLSGGSNGGMSIIDQSREIHKGDKEIDIILDEAFLSNQEKSIQVDIHLFFEGVKNQNSQLSLLNPPELI